MKLGARTMAACAAAAVFGSPLGAAAAGARSTSADASFVRAAAQTGRAEVALAALALRRSRTPQIVAFATRTRDNDTSANGQLWSLAQAQRFPLPAGLNASDRAQLARLDHERGHAFDVDYLQSQLRDHRRMLSLYGHETAAGLNTYVVAFAHEMVPVLDAQIFVDRRALATVEHAAHHAVATR